MLSDDLAECYAYRANLAEMQRARHRARARFLEHANTVREVRQWSLRKTAELLHCSVGMLHDMEHGRRWSDRIAREIVKVLG